MKAKVLLLRAGKSVVAVNRKTGMLASIQPRIQFETPQPPPVPQLDMSLTSSLLLIEDALRRGSLVAGAAVQRDVRRLHQLLEKEDAHMFDDADVQLY